MSGKSARPTCLGTVLSTGYLLLGGRNLKGVGEPGRVSNASVSARLEDAA
jgi:hypothetical protein